MSTETRLAELLSILEEAGLECLVMGGHAVRFYGVGRNTVDFKLEIAFLSLPDLIRSKETEREGDWADVSLLEEILDDRHLAQATISGDPSTLLSSIASRRGFERTLNLGLLADHEAVRSSAQRCEHPVSFAFLLPFAADSPQPASLRFKIDEAFLAPLRHRPYRESASISRSLRSCVAPTSTGRWSLIAATR